MDKKYAAKLNFVKNGILKMLKHQNTGLNRKQLAWRLNMKGSQYLKIITRAINELKKESLITKSDNYKFTLGENSILESGEISINASGNGYLKSPNGSEEIFISRKNTLNALHGDTVVVKSIKRRGRKNKLEAVVSKVLVRNETKFVGYLKQEGDNIFFIPINDRISDFFIPKEKLKKAKPGNKVIVEFTDWPLSTNSPFGKVIRCLDDSHTLKSEIDTIMQLFNIKRDFSKKIKDEIKTISTKITLNEIQKRRDFRKDLTFTIDPVDAKDFDDAISIKFLKTNLIEVGIHIADVSHYVKPGSTIDKEAFLRAFSIYFPGQVVPMLPEELSNNICSLKPTEDRLSFSVVVHVDKHLNISPFWIGRGVINSNKRFTYEDVEAILNAEELQFETEILELYKIAKSLRSKRLKGGGIDFERSDIAFELNHKNEPIKVHKKHSLKSHKLVEEFMLLANRIVAETLSSSSGSIYRVHDLPDNNKVQEVAVYLNSLETRKKSINISHKNLAKVINSLLKENIIDTTAIQNLVLRAMAKANYSTRSIGHYGLGFEKYTHFTSPIRRYADLVIHRILASHLNKKTLPLRDLEKKCQHFSNTERKYLDVERKVNKFMQLKLLENCINQVFPGIISGITNWGIYVELEDGKGEGLVPIRTLSNERYYQNEDLKVLIGKKSGKKYKLGQKLIVKIKSINLVKSEMDFELVS